jgi:hypothetical protein
MDKKTVIDQITGTFWGIVAIIVGCPIAGIALTSMNGELHSLADIPKIIMHGLPASVGLACGWIFFKSPFAPALQGTIVAAKAASKEVTTDLAGTVTTKERSLEINIPEAPTPPPAKS